jgi:D-glycero-alpha-D-manno-heptose-7-phosphate kinase
MSDVFHVRAPLRLGLAGGGTDVSPFSDIHLGYVLNVTIDLYTQAILEPNQSNKIVFMATDREESLEFNSIDSIPDGEILRLHRGIYNHVVRNFNGGKPLSFTLTTFSDAPAGSGLGTSSTLVVCILKAFSDWLNLGLNDYQLANVAFHIERIELGLTGGKQDQYAAVFGGFNFMEFGPDDRVLVNPLRLKEWVVNEIESSTILFYTGQSRESDKIIKCQIHNSEEKTSKSFLSMMSLKQDALNMKEAILKGDLKQYVNLINSSWESKKCLADGISNVGLDEIYSAAIAAGAVAGKISGAGGGGFFMFFVPPKKRNSVLRELGRFKGQVMNFKFTSVGVHGWKTLNHI